MTINVEKELETVYNISRVICWTDSTICLHWINNSANKYELFVQNRLLKIRELYGIELWKYVETQQNPADTVLGGSSLSNFRDNCFWVNSVTVAWLVYDLIFKSTEKSEELTCIVSSSVHYLHLSFIDISKFSSYERLLRVTAWILRFVNYLKLRLKKQNGLKIFTLLSDEREEAIIMWIKHV